MEFRMTLAVTTLILAGCGGASFSTEFAPPSDGSEESAARPDAEAPDTATVPDAGSEAAPRADATPEASPEAAPLTCACGDAGTPCSYSASEPPSGYGAPRPVTTLALTPGEPSAEFTASVTAVPQPYHDAVWYDLDVSAFAGGGTLYVQGQVGEGCTVSEYLLAECATMPTEGSVSYLEGSGNAVGGWMFPSYQFPAGTTVLHFGTEGGWGNPAGSANTNEVTVLVQP